MSLDKTEKLVLMPEIITYKQTIWTVDETGIDAISWVDETGTMCKNSRRNGNKPSKNFESCPIKFYTVCQFQTQVSFSLNTILTGHEPCHMIKEHVTTPQFYFHMCIVTKKPGSFAVQVNWNFAVILPCFAIFKNVEHSLEPGETPSYSASHQAQNYVQRS